MEFRFIERYCVFVIEQPSLQKAGAFPERCFKLVHDSLDFESAKKFIVDNDFTGYKYLIIPNCIMSE